MLAVLVAVPLPACTDVFEPHLLRPGRAGNLAIVGPEPAGCPCWKGDLIMVRIDLIRQEACKTRFAIEAQSRGRCHTPLYQHGRRQIELSRDAITRPRSGSPYFRPDLQETA